MESAPNGKRVFSDAARCIAIPEFPLLTSLLPTPDSLLPTPYSLPLLVSPSPN
ncbi:MAG: hypothetical protein F6K56_37630 [Moorea sp. SIO3G5]|nr:hypothetical protein [Moorena sp. SIO3G5]